MSTVIRRRWKNLPIFWHVFVPNAAILVLAVVFLAVSPATVSSPVLPVEIITISVGVMAMIAADVFLFRRALDPLGRLSETMQRVDPLEPGKRADLHPTSREVVALESAFNRMLARLEVERRESARRTLAAEEEERRRLARELHDELNQSLVAIVLGLNALTESADDAVAEDLSELREEVRALSGSVQDTVRRLRPETLDDLGLASALTVLCSEVHEGSGLSIKRLMSDRLPQMSPEIELVLYRVAQESLTNAVRHADADQAIVGLDSIDGKVRLSIEDDGRGMNGAVLGEGVRGMRERAVLVGGHLEIARSVRGGTRVSLTVPPST